MDEPTDQRVAERIDRQSDAKTHRKNEGGKQKRWVVETLAVESTCQSGFRCIPVSGHPAGGVGTDSLSLA